MRYAGRQIISHYLHRVIQAFKRAVAVILYHATQVILPGYGIHGNRHGPVNSEPRQELAFRIYKAETSSIDRSLADRPADMHETCSDADIVYLRNVDIKNAI